MFRRLLGEAHYLRLDMKLQLAKAAGNLELTRTTIDDLYLIYLRWWLSPLALPSIAAEKCLRYLDAVMVQALRISAQEY